MPGRQLIGNISTALIIVLCYFNFLLFENYLRLIVWAFLVSQALRQAKTNIVSILEYLSDDPDVNRYVRVVNNNNSSSNAELAICSFREDNVLIEP